MKNSLFECAQNQKNQKNWRKLLWIYMKHRNIQKRKMKKCMKKCMEKWQIKIMQQRERKQLCKSQRKILAFTRKRI